MVLRSIVKDYQIFGDVRFKRSSKQSIIFIRHHNYII